MVLFCRGEKRPRERPLVRTEDQANANHLEAGLRTSQFLQLDAWVWKRENMALSPGGWKTILNNPGSFLGRIHSPGFSNVFFFFVGGVLVCFEFGVQAPSATPQILLSFFCCPVKLHPPSQYHGVDHGAAPFGSFVRTDAEHDGKIGQLRGFQSWFVTCCGRDWDGHKACVVLFWSCALRWGCRLRMTSGEGH